MAQPTYDVIVIGEGVSGLTAAGALAQAGLKVATIEAQLFGGLVINVNELEPAPEGRPHSGAELASEMMQANAEAGVDQHPGAGHRAARRAAACSEVVTDSRHAHRAPRRRRFGARLKRLGVPGEDGVRRPRRLAMRRLRRPDVPERRGDRRRRRRLGVPGSARARAATAARVHLVHRGDTLQRRAALRRAGEGERQDLDRPQRDRRSDPRREDGRESADASTPTAAPKSCRAPASSPTSASSRTPISCPAAVERDDDGFVTHRRHVPDAACPASPRSARSAAATAARSPTRSTKRSAPRRSRRARGSHSGRRRDDATPSPIRMWLHGLPQRIDQSSPKDGRLRRETWVSLCS